MSSTTIDTWAAFWAAEYDERRQAGRIETCANSPLKGWLTLDVGRALESAIGLTMADVRQRPDDVLSAAREGFEQFVADEPECPSPADSGYASLAVHLIGLPASGRVDSLDDPVGAAGRLRSIPRVSIESPTVHHQALQTTYRCPAGHETTLDQPLYRYRSIDRCGAEECHNDVFVDDGRTRSRPVVEFSTQHRDSPLRCLGVGRLAAELDRVTADPVRLVGIPRRETRDDGSVEAVFEVVTVERLR